MIYSDFAIEQLKQRLVEKAMKDSTPKKFSGDMFEAYEVICQLQRQPSEKGEKLRTTEGESREDDHG